MKEIKDVLEFLNQPRKAQLFLNGETMSFISGE